MHCVLEINFIQISFNFNRQSSSFRHFRKIRLNRDYNLWSVFLQRSKLFQHVLLHIVLFKSALGILMQTAQK